MTTTSSPELLLILVLSSDFMEFQELTALAQSSKRLISLFGAVRRIALPGVGPKRRYVDDILLRIRLKMPGLTDLTIKIVPQYLSHLDEFMHLTTLNIVGCELGPIKWTGTPHTKTNLTLRTLNVGQLCGKACEQLYPMIIHFGGLTTLSLRNCSPVLIAGLELALQHAESLVELNITQCITDRSVLHLNGLKNLRTLSITKCPNIIGLAAVNPLPKLTHCTIDSCPITARVTEDLLLKCPSLRSLSLHKCSKLMGQVTISHAGLTALSVQYCDSLVGLTVRCPNLSHLEVRSCYALRSCAVTSGRLRALDLSQHTHLVELSLCCPRLAQLDVTGCDSFGSQPPCAASDSYASTQESSRDEAASGGRGLRGANLLHALDMLVLASDSDSGSDTDSTHSSETTRSGSEASSKESARLVSSPSVLGAAAAHIPTLPFTATQAPILPAEAILLQLHACCPSLDCHGFVRDCIRSSALAVHIDHLQEVLSKFSPRACDHSISQPAAGVKSATSSPGSRKGARKSTVTPTKRKARRASKKQVIAR